MDHRDRRIKVLSEDLSNREKDNVAMAAYLDELQRALKDKSMELDHLRERIDILLKEKESSHAAWEQERAEWRQLWDRARGFWEKKS